MSFPIHPIMEQSFALLTKKSANTTFSLAEYAIVRRVIHSTADFEFKQLIDSAQKQLRWNCRLAAYRLSDVGMVKQGVVAQTLATRD